jgi:hypothetical protein
MAIVGVEGFSKLPTKYLTLCCIFFAAALTGQILIQTYPSIGINRSNTNSNMV